MKTTIARVFLRGYLALAVGTLFIIASGGAVSFAASSPTIHPQASAVMHVSIVETNGRYSFEPAVLRIPKGTAVAWMNNSDASHTVTSDTNTFGTSSDLQGGQSFETVFSTAGTFAYHCKIHSYMRGTIIVTS